MKATDILMEEHRVIESVLDALSDAADRLEAGEKLAEGYFSKAADFIQGFADGCHHRKEEGVLFQYLAKYGMPPESGPVGVMLAEHEQGRGYTRRMRSAAEKLVNGDPSAREEVIQNVRGYVNLLRGHILKEDQVLFPMAGQVIPAEQHPAVTAAFDEIEEKETGEGVHEKYLDLAHELGATVHHHHHG